MRKALVIAGLLLLTPSFSVAEDDMSAALNAYAEAFSGTWVNDSTLDADVEGVGKKGDKLVAQLTFQRQDGLIVVDWKAEVNGRAAGSTAKGLIGWDASQKKLRLRWFGTVGSSGTSVYTQRGNGWARRGQSLQPDGTKNSSRSVIKFSDNDTYVDKLTDRVRGEESLPDREYVWKRKQ
jgi:hypothetical protein